MIVHCNNFKTGTIVVPIIDKETIFSLGFTDSAYYCAMSCLLLIACQYMGRVYYPARALSARRGLLSALHANRNVARDI